MSNMWFMLYCPTVWFEPPSSLSITIAISDEKKYFQPKWQKVEVRKM